MGVEYSSALVRLVWGLSGACLGAYLGGVR